jgi:hypothetical protein
VQRGDLHRSHRNYAVTRGAPDASDHTSEAAVDRYTNTTPHVTDSLPVKMTTRPVG